MTFFYSVREQAGIIVNQLLDIDLTIPYLYVIIYALLLLLCMLFNSKRGLIVLSCILAFYLGVLQGYPYITSSLDKYPLLWLLYLTAGVIYLISIGISMFMDR